MEILLKGAMISGGLIIAIGAQNAFVLRQGLLEKNVFWVVLTCFLCDFFLMSLGVLGLGSLVSSTPWVSIGLAFVGGLFLTWYGSQSLYKAVKSTTSLEVSMQNLGNQSPRATILAALSITLLNPHVYLDTVVLIGGIAGSLPLNEKIQFLSGALFASFAWFTALGYGAKALLPIFRNPRTWNVLDALIALVMYWIAYGLFSFAYLEWLK